MRSHLRMTAVLAAALLFTACLNVGRDFPVEPVAQLEVGVTTRDEVKALFGEPWRTGLEDGQKTWTYARYRYSAFGPAQTRDLVVRFGGGVVASYSFNSTHPEDSDL